MKITSKHVKVGTGCIVLADHNDGVGGTVKLGDTVKISEILTAKLASAGPLCKHTDGTRCYVPVQLLKRIKRTKLVEALKSHDPPVEEPLKVGDLVEYFIPAGHEIHGQRKAGGIGCVERFSGVGVYVRWEDVPAFACHHDRRFLRLCDPQPNPVEDAQRPYCYVRFVTDAPRLGGRAWEVIRHSDGKRLATYEDEACARSYEAGAEERK